MPGRAIVPRLNDILRGIAIVETAVRGKTSQQFAAEPLLWFGIERAIEIVSEACRHIPQEERARHPEIPWANIMAIGNKLRHEYNRLDPEIIWEVATTHLKVLRPVIEAIKARKSGVAAAPTRIDRRFASLKKEGRAALVTFVTAGDPDYGTAKKIVLGLPRAGADIIELGMPFSDPMADGPAIQASSQRALKSGMTLAKTLQLVREFRAEDAETPIVLMGYYNPIYVYPRERFLDEAKASGVDGLIVVDVPPEADDELCLPAVERGLNFIRLATPTTDDRRLPAVLANTSGFLYYVSITGITGMAAPDVAAVHDHVKRIKRSTKLPVAVGFGVKTPQQAQAIATGADGVVVGSALVTAILQSLDAKGTSTSATVASVLDLVKSLSSALRAA